MPKIFAFDKTPYDSKFFATVDVENVALLKGCMKRILYWNRVDLLDDLKKFCTEHGVALPVVENLADGDIPKVGGPIRGDHPWEESRPHHPKVVDGRLRVHRHSAIAFMLGEPGHSYTGIVLLSISGEAVDRKIFLVPVQPSESRAGAYATRPHDPEKLTRVYRSTTKPIEHSTAPNALPSHRLVVDTINLKFPEDESEGLDQNKGDVIGFNVIKGGGGLPNRYGFTSASSNKPTFLLDPGKGKGMLRTPVVRGEGYVPHEWGQAITLAVNKLLDAEAFVVDLFESKAKAVEALADGPSKRNELWQELRNRFWLG